MGILREVFREARADNLTGEAAKAAYYFFLSLFPLLIAVFALTGLVGGDRAFDWIMSRLRTVVPGGAGGGDVSIYLEDFVRQITDQRRPELLSFGILLTLWSASNFFAALADGLDRIFDVESRATWLKKHAKALLMLGVGVLTLVAGAVLILAGPQIARAVGLGGVAELLSWPLAFLLVAVLFALCYYILPARDQGHLKKEIAIGALAGTALWLLATAGFRFYVTNFGSYSDSYGIIGGVIVLLLWLYLSALTVLLGGEVVDVLESRGRAARGAEAAGGEEEPRRRAA